MENRDGHLFLARTRLALLGPAGGERLEPHLSHTNELLRLLTRMFRRWRKYIEEYRRLENRLEEEKAYRLAMNIDEARLKSLELIAVAAQRLRVTTRSHSELPRSIENIDPMSKDFFDKFDEIYVYEGDIHVSVNLMDSQSPIPQGILIGQSETRRLQFVLIDGGPEVATVADGVVVQRYPSIYHFLLVEIP